MPDVYKQSFKQNYTNNIELSIFNCGLERCAPGQTWGPGIRDHYLIHLVVSGKGIFEVGGRTWEVSEGDLFFARPSQLIRYTADELPAQEEARKKAEAREKLPETVAALQEDSKTLKEENKMLKQCLMEMSEIVYA